MKEKLYEEVGNNYRLFLRWRHASFAGNLVVLGAVLSFSISAFKDAKELMWIIPLFASPIGVLLWIIDVRSRSLYHTAMRSGKELENGTPGFYTKLIDEGVAIPKGKSVFTKLNQSLAVNILFLGSSVLLCLLSVLFYWKWGN